MGRVVENAIDFFRTVGLRPRELSGFIPEGQKYAGILMFPTLLLFVDV